MDIYLLRHGIAVPQKDPAFVVDGERPLTAKGIKRMRKAARGMRRLKFAFGTILTSPLVRARQTAEIVAKALEAVSSVEDLPELGPEGSPRALLGALERFKQHESLLLVGHEPLLGRFAAFLLAGPRSSDFTLPLKKGGLCRIDIDALPMNGLGTLQWMLSPKQLRLLAP